MIDITLLPPEHRAKAELDDYTRAQGKPLALERMLAMTWEERHENSRKMMEQIDGWPRTTRLLVHEHGSSIVRACLKKVGFRHERLAKEIEAWYIRREAKYLDLEIDL